MSREWNKDDRRFDAELERKRKRMLAEGKLWSDEVKKPKAKAPKVEIPTFSECVIGYREWYIDALAQLRPITYTDVVWPVGLNEATCEAHRWAFNMISAKKHQAPAPKCTCGIYSRFDIAHITNAYSDRWQGIRPEAVTNVPVIGAIANWGRLQVHHDGIRAEKACVVALCIEPHMPRLVVECVERAAARYRVPAVPLDMLALEAGRHGNPLPEDVRPSKPEPKPDPMAGMFGMQPYHQKFYYASSTANAHTTTRWTV